MIYLLDSALKSVEASYHAAGGGDGNVNQSVVDSHDLQGDPPQIKAIAMDVSPASPA